MWSNHDDIVGHQISCRPQQKKAFSAVPPQWFSPENFRTIPPRVCMISGFWRPLSRETGFFDILRGALFFFLLVHCFWYRGWTAMGDFFPPDHQCPSHLFRLKLARKPFRKILHDHSHDFPIFFFHVMICGREGLDSPPFRKISSMEVAVNPFFFAYRILGRVDDFSFLTFIRRGNLIEKQSSFCPLNCPATARVSLWVYASRDESWEGPSVETDLSMVYDYLSYLNETLTSGSVAMYLPALPGSISNLVIFCNPQVL